MSNLGDLVRSFSRKIERFPLLTHEQEIILGRQVQELMQVERLELEIVDLTGEKPSLEVISQKLDLTIPQMGSRFLTLTRKNTWICLELFKCS